MQRHRAICWTAACKLYLSLYFYIQEVTFVGKRLLLYCNTVIGAPSFVAIHTCAQNNKIAMFAWGCTVKVTTALQLLTCNKASSVVEESFGV